MTPASLGRVEVDPVLKVLTVSVLHVAPLPSVSPWSSDSTWPSSGLIFSFKNGMVGCIKCDITGEMSSIVPGRVSTKK